MCVSQSCWVRNVCDGYRWSNEARSFNGHVIRTSAATPLHPSSFNYSYLQDPQAILCVINSATVDPATSYSLREAFKADRVGDRSIGVITKVDLVGENKDSLQRLLANEVSCIYLFVPGSLLAD